MREDRIKVAVEFLKGNQEKTNISHEDQKKFLESHLTEDEITEAFKRFEDHKKSGNQTITTSDAQIA